MSPLDQQILQQVHKHGRGKKVYSASDFADLAYPTETAKALARLVVANKLRRVGHALFDFPRIDRATKRPLPPTVDSVVAAVVRRDGIRVLIDGQAAAHELGLAPAPPPPVTLLTDGATRIVSAGDIKINFRRASTRQLRWAGRPAASVVQTILWIGHELLNDTDKLQALERAISPRAKKDLKRGKPYMPIWSHPIVDHLAGS